MAIIIDNQFCIPMTKLADLCKNFLNIVDRTKNIGNNNHIKFFIQINVFGFHLVKSVIRNCCLAIRIISPLKSIPTFLPASISPRNSPQPQPISITELSGLIK